MLSDIVNWFYRFNAERQDWSHMCFGLWLYAIGWAAFDLHLWWIGAVFGVGLEIIQYLFIDNFKLMLFDRFKDAWGHAITVTMVFASPWSVLAGVVWYFALWLMRQSPKPEQT